LLSSITVTLITSGNGRRGTNSRHDGVIDGYRGRCLRFTSTHYLGLPGFAYVTSWCLVVACLWLTPLIWKVTLFEGGIRGPTRGFGFRTLAWDDISSAERMPLGLRSLGIGFDAALCLQATGDPGIVITEPLVGMQEFKEPVRRLAGEDHPFTRLLYER
jgi:hypothetical protein